MLSFQTSPAFPRPEEKLFDYSVTHRGEVPITTNIINPETYSGYGCKSNRNPDHLAPAFSYAAIQLDGLLRFKVIHLTSSIDFQGPNMGFIRWWPVAEPLRDVYDYPPSVRSLNYVSRKQDMTQSANFIFLTTANESKVPRRATLSLPNFGEVCTATHEDRRSKPLRFYASITSIGLWLSEASDSLVGSVQYSSFVRTLNLS